MKKLRENNKGFSPLGYSNEAKICILAKKLSKKYRGKESSYIFHDIKLSTSESSLLFKNMPINDYVVLCFLINKIKEGMEMPEIVKIYQNIIPKIFTFSTVTITQQGSEVSCGDCGGDGYYSCESCDGSGGVYCYECDGDGSDSDGNTCENCDGAGSEDCSECNGDGNISCGECLGSGYYTDHDLTDVTQEHLISIDNQLYDILETKEFKSVFDNSIISDSVNDGNTIFLSEFSGNSDEFLDDDEGDVLFIGVERGFDCLKIKNFNLYSDCFEHFVYHR